MRNRAVEIVHELMKSQPHSQNIFHDTNEFAHRHITQPRHERTTDCAWTEIDLQTWRETSQVRNVVVVFLNQRQSYKTATFALKTPLYYYVY